MDNFLTWVTGNWIEISGAVISVIYLYFSYRQIIWLWPFGLLSALFYIWIYYDSGFYADMSLQLYYVFISIYGWYHWNKGKNGSGEKNTLKISRLGRNTALILTGIFLVIWVIIYVVLENFTNSMVPVMDALTTAGSIIATWMLARKILEHWLVWVIVDAISLGLYLYKELYATSVLFLIYTIVAVAGYYAWRNDLKSYE